MADFREEQFEILAAKPDGYDEIRYVYGDIEDALETADNLRAEGFDVEMWKLTIFEEYLG
jgi:hypothetical protein